jgi:hypothetical protein
MGRLLFIAIALLGGCDASLAQVSTMGTTGMGLSSTPGAIVSSPLNGPSPFSAATQPGAPDTTLAPVPLASDPTTPGTVVTCSPPTGQIAPGTPPVPVASMSAMVGTAGTMPPVYAAPTISALPPGFSTPTTGSAVAPLTFSQQPETSSASVFPGSMIPVPQPPAVPPLPQPSLTAVPVPTPSTVPFSTSMPGTTTMTTSSTMMPAAAMASISPLGTIPTPIVITTTGNIAPITPLGSSSTTVCSSTPGGPPSNGADLPLSTPQIPANPPLGTIQPAVTQLGGTSIDPTTAVMPTPNTSACAESMTMNLANPAMMAPANAAGATATPGVSSPSGC